MDAFLNDLNIHLPCLKCQKTRIVKLKQMRQNITCSCGHFLHKNNNTHIDKIMRGIQFCRY